MSHQIGIIGGRRHRPRGRRRGAQGGRRDRRQRTTRCHYDLGGVALPRAPARCCPTRCSRSCAATTRSCSARSAPRTSRPGVLERGLLLKLRFELDLFVNLRPFSAAGERAERRRRLRRDPREHRGHLRGRGRLPAARHAARGRDPGFGEHPLRRRALRPLRVRPRRSHAAAPAPDPRAQDERPHVRRRPLAAHVRRGRRRVPRRHDRLRPHRRRVHPLRAATRALRRDRHRQPLRRHPHRPRRRDRRAASGAPRRRT